VLANPVMTGNGSWSVLLNRGDGTFTSAADFVVDSSPGQPAIGDLDGDGQPDLVLPAGLMGSVRILLGGCQ